MTFDNQKTWWHLFGRRYSTYKENNITFTLPQQKFTYKWNTVCYQVQFSANLGEEGTDFSSCPYTRNSNTYNQMSQFAKLDVSNETMATWNQYCMTQHMNFLYVNISSTIVHTSSLVSCVHQQLSILMLVEFTVDLSVSILWRHFGVWKYSSTCS
jgi:hypothetical protein